MSNCYAASKSPENQREARRLIKWLLILTVVPISLLLLFGIIYENIPGYGLRALREVLDDTSFIQDVEVIRENRESAGLDYSLYLDARIPVEAARQMTQSNVLRRCNKVVDGKKYACGDPVWEVPSEGLMYPSDYNENTLCAMSWRADIDIDRNFEDTDILCVDVMTGELWFSHYSY